MALPPKNIYLIGFMGTGKTLVGHLLAEALKRSFVDLDQTIETETGMTVSEIFERHGEAHFRELEHRALESASKSQNLVISTGGGTVLAPGHLDLMRRTGWVVALTADLDTLTRRLERDVARPLIRKAKGRPGTLAALYHQRLPLYEQADLVLDATSNSPEELVKKIRDRL